MVSWKTGGKEVEAVPIVAGGGPTKQVGDKPRWHKVMQGGTRWHKVAGGGTSQQGGGRLQSGRRWNRTFRRRV